MHVFIVCVTLLQLRPYQCVHLSLPVACVKWNLCQHAQTSCLLVAHLLGTLCDTWKRILWAMVAGNVTVIADKIVNTAMLARDAALPYNTSGGSPFNGTNDQKAAQTIVSGLNQATISPEIQGQAFAQALTQALNTLVETEAPEIIIAAAMEANQINSITQGFAQVREVWHN